MTRTIFDENNPEVLTVDYGKAFNRFERRNSQFVIRNNTNGKFVKRTKTGDKVKFTDVELEQASSWRHRSIRFVLSELLVHEPNLNLEECMVYKIKDKLCVK